MNKMARHIISGNIHNSAAAAAVHYQIQLHCRSISSTPRLDVSWMDKIKGVFTGKKPAPTAETPTATKTAAEAAAGAADQSFTLLRFADEMGKARKLGTLKQYIVGRSSEATFSEAFGKQEAILRYLGGIDPTGENLKISQKQEAAKQCNCTIADIENTLAKFMWAKEAQSKMQKLQEEGKPLPKSMAEVQKLMGSTPLDLARSNLAKSGQISRNALCPCGSKKRYKKMAPVQGLTFCATINMISQSPASPAMACLVLCNLRYSTADALGLLFWVLFDKGVAGRIKDEGARERLAGPVQESNQSYDNAIILFNNPCVSTDLSMNRNTLFQDRSTSNVHVTAAALKVIESRSRLKSVRVLSCILRTGKRSFQIYGLFNSFLGASWIHPLLILQVLSAFTKPSGMEDYQIMGRPSPVVDSVKEKLMGLTSLSSSSCIYRVPEHLRRINKEEYTPMVVSIGPLHHGDAMLLSMEEHKVRYLHALLEKTSNKDLTGYVRVIERHVNKLREYYAEKISTSENAFIEMVLLDSAFIIETFLKSNGIHEVEETDRIFSRPGLISQIVRDMKLLENQLPFFILEELYNLLIRPKRPSEYFRTMTFKFFKVEPRVSIPDIKHFVDLFRTCSLPQTLRDPSEKGKGKMEFRACVTELQEAGVRFEKKPESPFEKNSLLEIEFDDKGILKIPQLKLQDDTESFFRNLVAYEQCHLSLDSYITDYIALINFVINTPKDVETLVDREIIVNWLGNSEEAADVFKRLFKQVNIVSSNFYYSNLCNQLEKFYKTSCNRYIAMLKYTYFAHPWAVLSVFTAVLLLVLSFIQAITGVISVSKSGSSNS
ncbi:UPF0481 protein-like protein [Drosera capensis]